jgi:hypothetical protein
LERGELGVRVGLRDCELVEEKSKSFAFRDSVHQTLVQLSLTPWRTVLEPPELVAQDVERATRALFERTWTEKPVSDLERALGQTQPLTRAPGFSPVVSCGRVTLPGGDALRVLYRSSYRPGLEVVTGRVLVPVNEGTFELAVTALDQATGERAAALVLVASAAGPVPPNFHQIVDDEDRDATFPHHCLSRVRAQLRALVATVEVTGSALVPGQQRISLPDSGVSLVPPPRFGLLSAGALPMPASHATFTRVGFSVSEPPWLFEVRRDASKGTDLEGRARAFYASWASQGVVQKSLALTPAPALGSMRTLRASFEGALPDGSPLQSRARWIDRGDEAVMLALNVEWADETESATLVDSAAQSIEWLPGSTPAPPAAVARPWWRFW